MIEWRPIPRLPRYEVSSCGEVRATIGSRMIAPHPDAGGYMRVKLTTGKGRRWFSIHSLVLTTFLRAKPTRLHEGAHKDGDKTNNHATNLVWKTRRQNEHDKRAHGTAPKGGKVEKLSDATRQEIVRLIGGGMSIGKIATRLDIHRKTVVRVHTSLYRLPLSTDRLPEAP